MQSVELKKKVRRRWERFWIHYAGLNRFGRGAMWLAARFAPPSQGRAYLATLGPGAFYISAKAMLAHDDLHIGEHIFIDDQVIISKAENGGGVIFGDNVQLNREIIMQTGAGGMLEVGTDTSIQPRCIFSAYIGKIQIGQRVQIAPHCTFYSYNHGIAPGRRIFDQPLESRGGITIGDDAWLGVGVTVLDGVHIGCGAVIGAGAVVTGDVPDHVIAAGNPARIIKHRNELDKQAKTAAGSTVMQPTGRAHSNMQGVLHSRRSSVVSNEI